MPSTLTYPGVYTEEIPSGVRSIAGVSTSVTAFVGAATLGPVNEPIRIKSFADYERRFGGIDTNSLMSYAVQQFFDNGGADAYVVRIAKGATAATLPLLDSGGATVLTLTARDKGEAGNGIEVRVTYPQGGAKGTFALEILPKDPARQAPESFTGLSMDEKSAGFVRDVLRVRSKLVTATIASPAPATAVGTSTSGNVPKAPAPVDATHRSMDVSLDGALAKRVTLDVPAANTAGDLATELTDALDTAFGAGKVLATVTDDGAGSYKIVLKSTTPGGASSIRVSPSSVENAAGNLKLGVASGGSEASGAEAMMPRQIPNAAVVTGAALGSDAPITAIPGTRNKIAVRFGAKTKTITLTAAPVGVDRPGRLASLAATLQQMLRETGDADPAFNGMTVTAGADNLVFTSGARVPGTLSILDAGSDTLATDLKLTAGGGANVGAATVAAAVLSGATETPFEIKDASPEILGSQLNREGIFALENVDMFNLLVLAGVSDPGVLGAAAAYCEKRRAFLIVDSPEATTTPADMAALASSASLPKHKNAAVYYPWISIGDRARGNVLRTVPPSGTIAGIYARTDATRGVWKAPAGTETNLVGVQAVEYTLTDPENGDLNPLAVNCIRNFPVIGPVSWGARTLVGADANPNDWKYVPVRRIALFIEESLYRGTKWAVFEPNDEPLWAQLRLNVGAFMQSLFRQGAFQGQTARDAYIVRCDRTTTTQTDINLGVVNIYVGFAPLKPAEFVVIRIQQMAGQIPT